MNPLSQLKETLTKVNEQDDFGLTAADAEKLKPVLQNFMSDKGKLVVSNYGWHEPYTVTFEGKAPPYSMVWDDEVMDSRDDMSLDDLIKQIWSATPGPVREVETILDMLTSDGTISDD